MKLKLSFGTYTFFYPMKTRLESFFQHGINYYGDRTPLITFDPQNIIPHNNSKMLTVGDIRTFINTIKLIKLW